MIGPVENFTDLGIEHRWLEGPVTLPRLDVEEHLTAAGLTWCKDSFACDYLILPQPDGTRKYLGHHTLYTLATPADMPAAVKAHVQAIAAHGPGRVWFLADPVHVVVDDGMAVVQSTTGSDDHMYLLRTFYGHEVQAV